MKRVAIHYTILQGLYWMLLCSYYAFGASYLIEQGLSNSLIGVVYAAVGGLSALLQTVLSAAADKSRKIPSKWFAVGLIIPACVMLALLCFVIRTKWLVITFYGAIWLLVMAMQFLLNALGMEGGKTHVNFGVSRSFGSMCYALTAYALGFVCAQNGTAVTIPIALCVGVLLTVALILWQGSPKMQAAASPAPAQGAPLDTGFFSRYPRFIIFFIGCLITIMAYSTVCNYNVRIVAALGGGSAELGTAIMITALCEIPTLIISSWLNKKFGSNLLMIVAVIMLSIRMLLMTFANSIPFLYAAMATQLLSYSLFISASVFYVDALMQSRDKLKGQAMMALVQIASSAIGSLLGGFLLDAVNVKGMLIFCTVLSFIGTVITIFGTKRGDMRTG